MEIDSALDCSPHKRAAESERLSKAEGDPLTSHAVCNISGASSASINNTRTLHKQETPSASIYYGVQVKIFLNWKAHARKTDTEEK